MSNRMYCCSRPGCFKLFRQNPANVGGDTRRYCTKYCARKRWLDAYEKKHGVPYSTIANRVFRKKKAKKRAALQVVYT